MRLSKAVTFLMGAAWILAACGGGQPSTPSPFRFIDRLTQENIEQSPLADSSSPQAEGEAPEYPEQSAPLQELAIPENPLGLKRRLVLGGTERNVLFAPPDSTYRFRLDADPDSVLEFAVGFFRNPLIEGDPADPQAGSSGVLFRIELEAEDRRRTLFQKYMPQPPGGTEFLFSRHTLTIPYALDDVHLSFTTRGDTSHYTFWANPVLYAPRASAGINVILISIDTLRADHLGCYGYSRDTSPNIDALAADGVRFTHTYAASPWTLPSHVALFTSRYGVHHQVYRENERMDADMLTLAEVMHAQGYACAAFTGGGFVSPVYGFAKGFESYDVASGGVFHQDSAQRSSRAVSDWIDRHRHRNFFLFIHSYQPHSPYACPPPFKTMFLSEESLFGHADLFQHLGGKENLYKPLPEAERQNLIDLYDGEIRYVDDRLIGPLLQQLKTLGLYDRTLIVFTSDHGEEFFEHGSWGHGQSLYDELLRVPLILKYPGSLYQGRVLDPVVSLVDVLPTLLDETGWKGGAQDWDGRSLKPVVQGRESADRRFFADLGSQVLQSHVPQRISTNAGRLKLILNEPYTPEDLAFFPFPPPVPPAVEVFDLERDPREKENIKDRDPALASRLIRWIKDLYAAARKAQTGKAHLDQSVRDQLKALGYIR